MTNPIPAFEETKVEAITQIADNAFLLSFKRSFDFLPGQVVALKLSQDEDPRYYSIASGNTSEWIEILFDVKPEGSLSPRLAELKPGDILYHSTPSGCFLATDVPAIWICAGTGIAPFRSMLLSGIPPALQMIQGGRTSDSLFFRKELSEIFREYYYPCCSREKADGTFHGRVTHFLEQKAQFFPDKLYYLCGSAEMVVDSREILLGKGIPYGNIIAEIYF